MLRRLSLDDSIEVHLLGDEARLSRYPWYHPGRFTALASPIYGIREQVELPARIPRCDVFWSPHYNVPLGPIRARRRLVTIHDVYPLAHFSSLTPAQKVYAKTVMKAAVVLADRVVTISEFSASEIRRRIGIGGGKLEVVSCGLDRDFAVFEEQAIPESEYLLFVGNVKPNKNLKGALAAFFRIADRHPGLRFVVVGRKEGFITGDSDFAGMLSGRGGERVVFTGHVSDAVLKTYYKRARALVFPSFYEGFGLPIVEAMAFGIPVVCSDRASLPEVGGDAVLYFDPADPASIANRMEDVLDGRWRPDPARYAERTRAFDWDAGSRRYAEIIGELAR